MISFLKDNGHSNTKHHFLSDLCTAQCNTDTNTPNKISGNDLGYADDHGKKFSDIKVWLEVNSNLVDTYFATSGLEYKLSIKKDASKGGRNKPSLYFVDVCELDTDIKDITEMKEYEVPKDGIRYEIINQKILSPGWLLDNNNDIILKGVKKILILLLSLSPIIIALLVVLMIAFSFPSSYQIPAGILFAISLYNPYYKVLQHGAYLRLFASKNSVMFIMTSELDSANEQRKIAYRTYIAKCKVCGGQINLETKSQYLKSGEIIGECRENPILHRYTFDYVTNFGERINYK